MARVACMTSGRARALTHQRHVQIVHFVHRSCGEVGIHVGHAAHRTVVSHHLSSARERRG